jgi:hypothetical protein
MRFEKFSFGSIRIEGVTYEHDVIIDHGQVRKRKKKPSKKFREASFFDQTLTIREQCCRAVSGNLYGRCPIFMA